MRIELSPHPPLSPSFILLSPLKFINEIYSVMASILTTWKWTAAELCYVESSGITFTPSNIIKMSGLQCDNRIVEWIMQSRRFRNVLMFTIRDCLQITLINLCAFIFRTIEPKPLPTKNQTLVQIWTKSWFGPILVWSLISTTMIFGAANYTFLEFLGPGQYNKTIFKMFHNCF